MSLPRKLYRNLRDNIRSNGVTGVFQTYDTGISYLSNLVAKTENSIRSTNVYEREWDVLILLDCATVGMMEEVQNDYDFITDIGEHFTPGTTSGEWMQNTFTDEYCDQMRQTLHITANTYSDIYFEKDSFLHLEEVWKDGWDKEVGTIPAHEVTDRAIYFTRKLDPNRTIIHYMQPHLPFVTRPDIEASEVAHHSIISDGMNLDELYHEAGYDRDELWDAHVENLRYVLDSIEVLLSSLEANQVVISADHGQAFGQKGMWGHGPASRIDQLRIVPWCVTSATDTGEYNPEFDPNDDRPEPDASTVEKMDDLGYL